MTTCEVCRRESDGGQANRFIKKNVKDGRYYPDGWDGGVFYREIVYLKDNWIIIGKASKGPSRAQIGHLCARIDYTVRILPGPFFVEEEERPMNECRRCDCVAPDHVFTLFNCLNQEWQ